MKLLLTLFILIFNFSCSHFDKPHENHYSNLTQSEYRNLIENNTENLKAYRGFYNIFEAWITPMNHKLGMAYIDRWADAMMWPAHTYEEKKKQYEKKFYDNAVFFLDFYTPDRKYNKLDMGSSIWKIYLKVNGKTFLGKVKKHYLSYPELKNLFYYHNSFVVPYDISFDVSMDYLINKNYKIILTSSEITREASFNQK